MHISYARSFAAPRVFVVVLCLVWGHAAALPTSSHTPDTSSNTLYKPFNYSLPGIAPSRAVCDKALGKLTLDDCNEAIKLLPHDSRGRPVVRNFYTDPSDASRTIPNQQLPFEKTFGGCTQVTAGLMSHHTVLTWLPRWMYCSDITCD